MYCILYDSIYMKFPAREIHKRRKQNNDSVELVEGFDLGGLLEHDGYGHFFSIHERILKLIVVMAVN